LFEYLIAAVYNWPLMRERGLVTALCGSLARVKFSASGACAKCGACLIENGRWATIEAQNDAGAIVGNTVEVEIEPAAVLLASFVVFIIPIILLIIGYYFGSFISEPVGVFTGVIFLGLSFLGMGLYDRAIRKSKRFTSRVVNIVKG